MTQKLDTKTKPRKKQTCGGRGKPSVTASVSSGSVSSSAPATKIKCETCGRLKVLSSYYLSQHGGIYSSCKRCIRIKMGLYHSEATTKDMLKQTRAYYEENKESITSQKRDYYSANKQAFSRRARKYYAENRESIAKQKKKYQTNNKERLAAYQREYIRHHQKAHKAHMVIRELKRKGLIKVPKRCTICHKIRDMDAHHPDYDKPTEVVWACDSCHQYHHSGTINIDRAELIRKVA